MASENPALKESLLRHVSHVPRYTSYPTAPHFRQEFGSQDYKRVLSAIPAAEDISLYIHIPFCPKLCWFCGCHTKITRRYEPVGDYTSLLRREIELTAPLLQTRRIRSIHFGGGSPSMLTPADFGLLMRALRDNFTVAQDAAIAIEIDPRNASEAKTATYARHGVTRASFGVQDFDSAVLAAVNRQQPFHCTYDAVKICREYGIDALNMDFMYGLPRQTVDTMRRAMELAVTMAPGRISLFGYAHVPWMKKHMRLMPQADLPDAGARFDLFAAASSVLEDAGYIPVGIDHFARKGDTLAAALKQRRLHRNFQGYTDDRAGTLVGLGVSAIGKTPWGYVQNAANMPEYEASISAGELPARKGYMLTAEDGLRAAVIESLMCYLAADIPALCREHGFPGDFLHDEMEKLSGMEADGLLRIENGIITLNSRHIARPACAAFDACLAATDAAPKKHAISI